MSTPSDGPQNIDTIRQLLQKIEQAAVEDAEKGADEIKAARSGARLELASLNRGPVAVTPLTPQTPIAARELQVPVDPAELDTAFEPVRRGSGARAVLAGMAGIVMAIAIGGAVFQNEVTAFAKKTFPDLFPRPQTEVIAKAPASGASVRPAGETTEKGQVGGGGLGVGTGATGQLSSAQPMPVPDPRSAGKAGPATLPTIALTLPPSINVQAGEAIAFPVTFEPVPTEADALLLIIRGVPEEMAFSQGSAIGNEIWLLPAHRATGLTLSSADNLDGSFALGIDLVAVDGRMVAQGRTELTVMGSGGIPPKPAVDDDELKRLVARGDKLLDTGDVAAARAWYERAAEAGSATGAFRLGETYDPLMLLSLGVRSLSTGDEAAARRWYERAALLGHQGAADRLKDLKR